MEMVKKTWDAFSVASFLESETKDKHKTMKIRNEK